MATNNTNDIMNPNGQFSAEAEQHLQAIYAAGGAHTTEKKIEVLNSKLGGTANFYAAGGCLTPEMKLGCLEYEYLESQGLIALTLV